MFTVKWLSYSNKNCKIEGNSNFHPVAFPHPTKRGSNHFNLIPFKAED